MGLQQIVHRQRGPSAVKVGYRFLGMRKPADHACLLPFPLFVFLDHYTNIEGSSADFQHLNAFLHQMGSFAHLPAHGLKQSFVSGKRPGLIPEMIPVPEMVPRFLPFHPHDAESAGPFVRLHVNHAVFSKHLLQIAPAHHFRLGNEGFVHPVIQQKPGFPELRVGISSAHFPNRPSLSIPSNNIYGLAVS